MDWDLIRNFVGGAVISGMVGWFFAWQGSKQLAETHRRVVLLLRALEANDIIELNRNEAGEATGVLIRLSGHVVSSSHLSADLTVVPRTETPPRPTHPPAK